MQINIILGEKSVPYVAHHDLGVVFKNVKLILSVSVQNQLSPRKTITHFPI